MRREADSLYTKYSFIRRASPDEKFPRSDLSIPLRSVWIAA